MHRFIVIGIDINKFWFRYYDITYTHTHRRISIIEIRT